MATVTRPAVALPDPGDDMDAEQVRDWINNILSFLESTSIDEANVDLSGTDGIVGKSTAQAITGLKSFESTAAAAGGVREVAQFGIDPASGTATDEDGGRFTFYADDDGGTETDLARLDWVLADASASSEDSRIDFSTLLAGTFGVMYSFGNTLAGVGSHTWTVRTAAAASIQSGFNLEWDPDGAGNMTDGSSGLRLAWLMPDDADAQNNYAAIDVVCLSDAAGAENARMDFYLADTSGSIVSQLQLANGSLSPTLTDDISLGTSSLNFSDLFLDSGAVINFDSGDVTVTHTANHITVAGGNLIATLDATSTLEDGVVATTQTASDNSTKVATTAYADAAGVATGINDIKGYVAGGALKWEVASGTTWSFGWWQDSSGQWWLLGNTAEVDTFTRAAAEFYLPTGDIADVPTS